MKYPLHKSNVMQGNKHNENNYINGTYMNKIPDKEDQFHCINLNKFNMVHIILSKGK